MPSVKEIFDSLDAFAPVNTKMDFDNPGLLVGRTEREVRGALVSLDITDDVVAEAADMGAELIVSHHPVFFDLKSVTDGDPVGRKIVAMLERGISAICMHTNLDAAAGGVNDALMEALGGRVSGVLNEEDGISRIGELEAPVELMRFLESAKAALECNGLRYWDASRPVKILGVCGGSGGGDLELAYRRGCDTYLTADVKYHQFLQAKELGINLIDADHFCTENVVTPVLAGLIRGSFPGVSVCISRRHGQTVSFC